MMMALRHSEAAIRFAKTCVVTAAAAAVATEQADERSITLSRDGCVV